jgi:hypothetical protein
MFLAEKKRKKAIAAESKRKAETAERLEQERLAAHIEAQKKADEQQKIKEAKKTTAKRIGVKSTLALNEEVVVTSFGKGSKANLEFRATADGKDVSLESKIFKTTATTADVRFSKGDESSATPNPYPSNVDGRVIGQDYLGVKDVLEKEIFGKKFPRDNIRIQIAHQILDIRKIIGLYVNDVVYAINNLQRVDPVDDEPYDLIGMTQSNSTLAKSEEYWLQHQNDKKGQYNGKPKGEVVLAAIKKMTPYMGYFGDAFKTAKKPPKGKKQAPDAAAEKNILAYNYDVLRILSFARQFTVHSGDCGTYLFNISDKLSKDLYERLKENFSAHVDGINKSFVENSSRNLSLIFKLLNVKTEDRKRVCEEFYRFSIFKDGKNLGINVTKLREQTFKKYLADVYAPAHDTYRKKINTIADFVINDTFARNKPLLDTMVEQLRRTKLKAEKETVYAEFAQKMWGIIGEVLKRIPKTVADSIQKESNNGRYTGEKFPSEWIAGVRVDAARVSSFGLFVSYLCNFLEGKEINELLSAYISSFENLLSLCKTLEELGESVEFAKDYAMFAPQNVAGVIDDLRLIHSIGKMKPDLSDAKKQLFTDALDVLGVDDVPSDEWFEKNLWEKSAHPFRNFIANNVIESNRFWYIVRYTNPKTCKTIAKNKKVVAFVLSKLPREQIDRYYQSVLGEEIDVDAKTKIGMLAKKLEGFSFNNVLDERQSILQAEKVEKLKSLVGLYLTVLYVLTKNMVKANARYFIAWQCFDRDYELLAKLLEKKTGDKTTFGYDGYRNPNHYAVIEYYLNADKTRFVIPEERRGDKKAFNRKLAEQLKSRHYTKKWHLILDGNLREAKAVDNNGSHAVRQYRNLIAHLGAVQKVNLHVEVFLKGQQDEMKSYFDLFNFVVQKEVFAKNAKWPPLQPYIEAVNKFASPCYDFVKLLNIPFAYNLPRYKNLSVQALFDERDE